MDHMCISGTEPLVNDPWPNKVVQKEREKGSDIQRIHIYIYGQWVIADKFKS